MLDGDNGERGVWWVEEVGGGGSTGTAGGGRQEEISPILHTCVADSSSNRRC